MCFFQSTFSLQPCFGNVSVSFNSLINDQTLMISMMIFPQRETTFILLNYLLNIIPDFWSDQTWLQRRPKQFTVICFLLRYASRTVDWGEKMCVCVFSFWKHLLEKSQRLKHFCAVRTWCFQQTHRNSQFHRTCVNLVLESLTYSVAKLNIPISD